MKLSAGLLPFRRKGESVEVFLVHPGGPFWAKRDEGAWSIPKGEHGKDENAKHAAKREFTEETGLPAPDGELLALGEATYGNKIVTAWAVEADLDAGNITSDTISLEWPPKSGKQIEFPECDRAEWCSLAAAKRKVIPGQQPLIEALAKALQVTIPEDQTGDSQLSLL